MFLDSDFYYIFGPALLVAIILAMGFRFWEGRKESELEKAISELKINIVLIGFLSIVLWFMLPSTPSLHTFGFPETIHEIQSNEQLLDYPQGQSSAIIRTTQVVQWFIFLFVWGLLTTLYSVMKALGNRREA
ncbi:hypothetical protein [Rhodohalobacter mucosus]|uniref:Uncharacterized protein n=1 Tax=Rhodohalobacter mucosus TaxID=2079485 RepID=A0A316TRC8_9BACT|nr:hypothetical protein [Rhodohalobacter mucosus]PWN06970.1 hypothetical protein DDZ15_06770 [Rhodohalobacter mucosus]